MPQLETREYKQYFQRRELYPFVSLASAEGVAAGLKGLESWRNASLRKTPETIHDINGRPLFLDYRVQGAEGDVGYVRAAASRVLGRPVISRIVGGRPWSYAAAVKKLTPSVKEQHPRWKIRNHKLVCYSYPKLGVMFTMADERGKSQRLIYDVADHRPIPEGKPDQDVEGAVAWSFYDSLPEDNRRTRLERLGRIEGEFKQLPSNLNEVLSAEVRIPRLSSVVLELLPLIKTKELQFCPHYDYREARSHHCFVLHGQQVNDYCAVATCQMILCYYRYYYTQDQIAPALGYTPGGGCPANQSAGYESLSNNHIDATFDNSPTWEKARDQINDLRPLKSGIYGHARACAGYSSSVWLGGTKKLYIYDPWPWDADYKLAGSIQWEDWDSIYHTNFIYTELQY
jgi:hypothetical protein